MKIEDHINKAARSYMFQMAKMIQFGGETLFVCMDGDSSEEPDQSANGYPGFVSLVKPSGDVVTFEHQTIVIKGEEINFYTEVSRRTASSLDNIEPSIIWDPERPNVMFFSDGSTLVGPVGRRVQSADGSIDMEYFFDASGGMARTWGELWASRGDGTDPTGIDDHDLIDA